MIIRRKILFLLIITGLFFTAGMVRSENIPSSTRKTFRHVHRITVYSSLDECLQNSQLAAGEREFLSRVLEHVKYSAVGMRVIEQLDGRFDFAFQFVDFPKSSTWGTYSPGLIKLNRNFLKGRCKHVKLHNLILCSSVVVHEMTHSVHRKNHIGRLTGKNSSWEALIKDLMLRELHCKVNQFELATELVNLLWSDEYRQGGHGHRFQSLLDAAAWNELVEARLAAGCDSFQAEAFARKKLIEYLWCNARLKEYINGRPVNFSIARSWHKSYGPAAGNLPAVNGNGALDMNKAQRLISLINGGVSLQWLMQNFPYKISGDRIDAADWSFPDYWFPAKMQQVKANLN